MDEKRYFDLHLKSTWAAYDKLNIELYAHKEGGNFYEGFPSFFKGREDEFMKVTNFDEFYNAVIIQKNRYSYSVDPYDSVKNSLNQSLRKLSDANVVKEYVNHYFKNNSESDINEFIENYSKYMSGRGCEEQFRKILLEMSYENALCYFSKIDHWNELNIVINYSMPSIKEHPHGKEYLYIALKNCAEKDKREMESNPYSKVVNFLLDNFSDIELKNFDFLPDIESFLSSKTRSQNIVMNEEEEIFTTKLLVDCKHAMNIHRLLKDGHLGNYFYLVDKICEYLVEQSFDNILDITTIHKHHKDSRDMDKEYIMTEVFIDKKEYDPKLKQKISTLLNKYIKDSVELCNTTEGIDFDKFTPSWLLQENLNNGLGVNQESKQKPRKI
jgi:hypothetical protein